MLLLQPQRTLRLRSSISKLAAPEPTWNKNLYTRRFLSSVERQNGNKEDGKTPLNSELTHIDQSTNLPKMVDVGNKAVTRRTALARSIVQLPPNLKELFTRSKTDSGDIQGPKGPVIATAIIAGTMAVKNTSNMIPFCHPLPIEKCDIDIQFDETNSCLTVNCTVGVSCKTGVEMEALTGASVASLCIYDMCKAMSHDIIISETKLISKTGGKSDISFQ